MIRALAELNDKDIHYAIAGKGGKQEYLVQLAKDLGVESQVHLLGFRNDVAELYHAADVFAFPSFREGLSVSVMEALACGLPVICSEIRGNVDLIEDGVTGYWANPFDYKTFVVAIEKMKCCADMRDACREASLRYDINKINQKMREIYSSLA